MVRKAWAGWSIRAREPCSSQETKELGWPGTASGILETWAHFLWELCL